MPHASSFRLLINLPYGHTQTLATPLPKYHPNPDHIQRILYDLTDLKRQEKFRENLCFVAATLIRDLPDIFQSYFCIPHFVFRPSGKAPREISAIKWREITLFLGYLRKSQGKYVCLVL